MNALNQAAECLRAGQKAKAQKILTSLVKSEPANAQAWYLLSHCMDDHNQQISCLKRTLRLNPKHPQARARLEKLTRAPGTAGAPTASAQPAGRSPERPTASEPAGYSYALMYDYDDKPARSKKMLMMGGLAILGVIVCLVVVGVVVVSMLQSPGQVAAVPSATATATDVPVATLPPTWTQTSVATPTQEPTREGTPLPTATEIPTLASPGPTALYAMQVLEAQAMDVRGLGRFQDFPRFITSRPAFLAYDSTKDADFNEGLRLLQMEWAYKALGILTPEFDLVDYNEKMGVSSTAALYVPTEKTVYVFGTQFTRLEAWFYVYEFGQVLVDQNFDLNKLGVSPQCMWDSQHCAAINALIEGDATLMLQQWFSKYASNEGYRPLYRYVPPSALSLGQKEPPAFAPMYDFPYDHGLEFVKYLYDRGGWSRVDQAYQNLPASTEQILHPEKYLAGEQPMGVSDPSFSGILGPDYILVNDDSLGEWETHLMLAYSADPLAQVDVETALTAVRGWGGNHYQVYQNLGTGQTVMAAHWAWDTQNDADQFNQAMDSYQNGRFGGDVFVLGAAACRFNGQISCMLPREGETLWLLAPSQEIMMAILGLYEPAPTPQP